MDDIIGEGFKKIGFNKITTKKLPQFLKMINYSQYFQVFKYYEDSKHRRYNAIIY